MTTADPTERTATSSGRQFARRVVVCVIVVLALLGVRLLWGWYVERAVRGHVEALRTRGEPVEAGDFAFLTVPDAENAAKYHLDAAAAAVPNADPPRATNMIYAGYPPYDAAWMAAAEKSEGAHGKLFALAREARQHSRAQFRAAPFAAPLITAPTGNLNAMRHLANILADGATLAHVRGDDAEAVERLRDLLHLARSLRHDQTMIGQLVGTGIDALACDATMILAPGLRLGGPPDPAGAPATTRPSARAAAQGLVATLLDEDVMRRGLADGLRFDRAMAHEITAGRGAGTWVIRPLVSTQLLTNLHNFDAYLDAAALPDEPRVKSLLAARVRKEHPGKVGRGAVPRYARWFGESWEVEGSFTTHFRVTAERRMAATSLAAQLFRADHGRWPGSLDELVPAYLPSVPRDPFTDDAPIGYVVYRGALPGGADRPMLISKGGDTDIGPYPEPMTGWEGDRSPVRTRRQIWQYRDLARFVPAPPATGPASTQAVEDQP